MNCQNVQKKLSALLDGEETGLEKERLEEHLKSCEECSQAWRQMRIVTQRVTHMKGYPVDEKELTDKIKRRIATRSGNNVHELGLGLWARVPVFALLLLIALGMGNYAGRSLIEVFLPPTEDPLTETLLLENGSSFGDVFLELTSTTSGERFDR